MTQLGGHALFLSPDDTQLGRGEPVEDSARVISAMVDIVMIRTYGHDIVERFAPHSNVPVINGLTDDFHPCQLLADMQTWFEHRGDIAGRSVCWVGDGNNMCQSYINAARQFDFELRIACPPTFEPDKRATRRQQRPGHIEHDPTAPSGVPTWSSPMCGRLWARKANKPGARAVRTLPGQCGADEPRRWRCSLHALPARPSRRGNQRRTDGFARYCDLGRGREPAARAESIDGSVLLANRHSLPPTPPAERPGGPARSSEHIIHPGRAIAAHKPDLAGYHSRCLAEMS